MTPAAKGQITTLSQVDTPKLDVSETIAPGLPHIQTGLLKILDCPVVKQDESMEDKDAKERYRDDLNILLLVDIGEI